MGYAAYVLCNCYKDGITSEPPYIEHLVQDETGIYLDFGTNVLSVTEEIQNRFSEFHRWMSTACKHQEMYFVYEDLSNISGMADFRYIIEVLGGGSKFPVLTKYLPVGNDGTLPIDFARKALEEVLEIERNQTIVIKTVLRIKESGEIIQQANTDNPGIFMWAGTREEYGLGDGSFFIVKNRKFFGKERSKLVFRSSDFKQESIGNERFRYIDNLSKNQYVGACDVCFINLEEQYSVCDLIVENQDVKIGQEYSYMTTPLKKLLNGSLETGNPIVWI